MRKVYTKSEAINIVSEAAKDYSINLANKNFIIIYRNRENSKIDYLKPFFYHVIFSIYQE